MARAKAVVEGDEKGPSKMGMVREALMELGEDAKPRAISDHIKGKHDTEIPYAMISSYKSNILNKDASRSSSVRIGKGGDINVSVSDVEVVQKLIERMGSAQLQHLIRVLSK